MPYFLEIEENCKKRLAKAGSKNPELKKAVGHKLKQILEDPYRFKPLRFPLQNKRRVHVLKSFVIVYEVLEKEKIIRVLHIEHHDNVYR